MPVKTLLILLCLLFLAWAPWARAGDHDFEIPEAEHKPYELGGKLEMRYANHQLNQGSARHRLNFYNNAPGSYIEEWTGILELQGSYIHENAKFSFLTHHAYKDTYYGSEWDNTLYEAYLSLRPSASLTLEVGKKSFQWGKGYAWNPVGFVNRPKDPDDPDLNLEGFTGAWFDYIKSFNKGSLNNLALTGLVLPVIDDWANPELGASGDINLAIKLYLLWYDTDIDFIFFDGPDQPDSYGFDFAKNLAENFEIHGELAYKRDVYRVVLDSQGQTVASRENQLSYMFGVRYLNARDTTFILEYYHNGAGYDQEQVEAFFEYQDEAWRKWMADGDEAVMDRAFKSTSPYYKQRNFGKDYIYFKAIQKEPFDILSFNPWVTVIANLRDLSFNLQPGMSYSPMTNLMLYFRVAIPIGPARSEFGEKQDTVRPELWIRYHF